MIIQRGSLLASAERAQGLPIVIDVLRAFSTSAVFFSLGIKSLILVGSPEEAFALRDQHGYLLAGENNGVKIDGFDFGNSPTELLRTPPERLRGKTVVLRTSAGTQGVVAAMKNTPRVILGSYLMAKSIAAYVRNQNPEIVSIAAMGQRLLETAPEDEACASYLEHLLADKPYDHFSTIWSCVNTPFIQRCLHGELPHIPPEDVLLCLQRDLFDFVLIAEKVDGLIRVTKHEVGLNVKPLTSQQLQHLLDFKGYGRLDAPIWFIGMEEGIGGQANNVETAILMNITARLKKYDKDVMDIAQAHLAMNYEIEKITASPTQVWTWMAKIALALSNDSAQSNIEYINKRLGRADGCTFLTELMPIPVVDNNSWPEIYESLTPYQSRDAYFEAVIEQRKAMLVELINKYSPKYIFAYGKRYHDVYKDLFSAVKFDSRPVKPFQIGHLNQTTVILTPFFGVGALSSNDFDALMSYIKKQPSFALIDC